MPMCMRADRSSHWIPAMVGGNVPQYEAEAVRLKKDAQTATDPHIRSALLEIADRYQKLADFAKRARS